MSTETGGFASEPADLLAEPVPTAAPAGYFAEIAFFGHIEHAGYVTEVTLHGGHAAYRIDLPEKIWGGNPLAWVEYAATAWFSDRPVTEASVRAAYESRLARAAEHARIQAEWQRADEQRALTASDNGDPALDASADYEPDPF